VKHCTSTIHRLIDALESADGSQHRMTFVSDAGCDGSLTYRELAEQALFHAGALRELGVRENDIVMLALPASVAHVTAMMGCVLTGALPCTVPMPARRPTSTATQVVEVASELYRPRLLVTTEACAAGLAPLAQRTGVRVIDDALLRAAAQERIAPLISIKRDDDPHHVQLTSGSTSHPKAAVLSHRNVIANVLGIGGSVGFDPANGDGTASWLPLYHDMGLLTLLSNMHYRAPLLMMQPNSFIRHPLGWLKRVADARATTTSVPTFALRYCVRRFNEAAMEGVDLSACRNIFIGGERVDEETLRDFARTFAPYGLDMSALQPCYGMAESTLAVSMHRALHTGRVKGAPYVIADRIDKRALIDTQRALATDENDHETVLAMGTPIEGMAYRIAGERGETLDERRVGEVAVRGTSLMSGYLSPEDCTIVSPWTSDGWFMTGDIGYIANGQLYILGRKKEIIIIRGSNYFPHEIEEALGADSAMKKSACAAFGLFDDTSGTERLIVVAEARAADANAQTRARLQQLLQKQIGFAAQEICFVEPGGLPRTTSGKLQRLKCKDLYASGALELTGVSASPAPVATTPRESEASSGQQDPALEGALA
jgi:acyl-CoA synthetase (AMP-forming)/AMP-acid ligase II